MGLAFPGIVVSMLVTALAAGCAFSDAVERSRQKRTMARMRSLVYSMEAYRAQSGHYPRVTDLATLVPLLQTYARAPAMGERRKLLSSDAWEQPLAFVAIPGADGEIAGYAFGSAGRDGVWEHADITAYDDQVTDDSCFECDIIFLRRLEDAARDPTFIPPGKFIRRPAGIAPM